MNKIPNLIYGAALLLFFINSNESWALRLDGRTSMSGEVLASACTIELNDRFQSVSMGESSLREFNYAKERPVRDLVIQLDNCLTSGISDRKGIHRKVDPPVRVRFDGIRGPEPWMFRTQGSATGIALMLRDERQEVVYPGVYLPVLYQKAYNQQVLKYQIELIPNGEHVTSGDYSATLRFNIVYE
ncbi:type 1 fimbrial protein [Salmonella enterica subsp. enterica serovar Caracas]|nr:type 1 fimbrial protein [Salmonella enterica subsp. enterica serovar Caracas]